LLLLCRLSNASDRKAESIFGRALAWNPACRSVRCSQPDMLRE
jgi:hypothetical protein